MTGREQPLCDHRTVNSINALSVYPHHLHRKHTSAAHFGWDERASESVLEER